jgi:hypothetical protein
MKITSINREIFTKYENFVNNLPKIDTTKESKDIVNYKVTDILPENKIANSTFLDEALKLMVNNLQSNNNHPLSKIDNMPIENYNEALNVLKQVSVKDIKVNGIASQANINLNDVLQLFLE